MKALLLSLFLMLAAFNVKAQTKCVLFKNGTFKTAYNGSTVIITRMGNYQREDSSEPRASVSYTVTWLDDCTYTLKPNEDLFTRFPETPKNALITVRITGTGPNAYKQTSTSNFNKFVFSSDVVRLN